MSDNLRGLVGLVGLLLVIGGVLVFVLWRKHKNLPKSWVHQGVTPPLGVETALRVISRFTPGLPQAGYIEWVYGPFMVGGYPPIKAAGAMLGLEPTRIMLTYFDKVEQSALAHEVGHAWNEVTKQGFGESPADARFVAWINTVNTAIAKELGR